MHYVRNRGAWLVVNLLFACLLCWLITPLFGHRSINASVFGRYSVGYAAFLSAWSVLVLTYAMTAIAGDRQVNRLLGITALAFLALAEVAITWVTPTCCGIRRRSFTSPDNLTPRSPARRSWVGLWRTRS